MAETRVDLDALWHAASTFYEIGGSVGRFSLLLDDAPLRIPPEAWGHTGDRKEDIAEAYDDLRHTVCALVRDGGEVLTELGSHIDLVGRRWQYQEQQAKDSLDALGRKFDDE